jgi:hypothetical protein
MSETRRWTIWREKESLYLTLLNEALEAMDTHALETGGGEHQTDRDLYAAAQRIRQQLGGHDA